MSELQQQAVHLISGLSDDNVSFLIEIIRRLMPENTDAINVQSVQAFERLDAARSEIKQYLPDDFEPERELEEARAERYGNFD